MKQVKSIKTLSSKRGPKYEIRKEHVTYTDGSTEDRTFCYEFSGKPLSGIKEADKVLAMREAERAVPTPTPVRTRKVGRYESK